MKVTVKLDDEEGTEIVYQNIVDCFVMVRQSNPVQRDDGQISYIQESKSDSWGDLREIVKQLRHSVYEIEAQEIINQVVSAINGERSK